MKSAVGRADLVRLLSAIPSEHAARTAELLGYFVSPTVAKRFTQELSMQLTRILPAESLAVSVQTPLAPPSARPLAPPIAPSAYSVPLLRMETMTFAEEPQVTTVPAEQGLLADDWKGADRSLFAIPKATPLASWSRLWPLLREALPTSILSRDPDVHALLRAICRGDALTRIPRLTRRVWSGRVSVWIDRSARLVPFWSDQADVCRQLRKVCGRSGFEVRYLDAPSLASSNAKRSDFLLDFRVAPETPVLVLGDLGLYGTAAERSTWLRTARRLQNEEVHISALVPCSPSRWDPILTKTWSALSWERGRRRGGVGIGKNSELWKARAAQLLKLISPAVLVQPGLLRELRLLLPPSEADASTEADVWAHEDVRVADSTGFLLKQEALLRWRKVFAEDVDATTKERISRLLGHFHEHTPKEMLRTETLVFHALVDGKDVKPPGDLEDALSFAKRLEATVRGGDSDDRLFAAVQRYGRMLLGTVPEKIYEKVPTLKMVWAAAFRDVQGARVPAGLDLAELHAALGTTPAESSWGIRQVGRDLVFWPLAPSGVWPSDVPGPGSPVAWLLAARPLVWVTRGGVRVQARLEESLVVELPLDGGLEIETDRSRIVIEAWMREPWAEAAGRDRYGLWADQVIAGVTQRFRWIPPGRFWMGSPEGEVGRSDDEGPQHLVEVREGFWLGNTPVTQALWTAVMHNNPSKFKKVPKRPVENVSWDDCQKFLELTSALLLPTEVQWEYACRAGTQTATWLGDLEIRNNKATLLENIAWYWGNSYGESQVVKQKETNPWALYDMLGNVYEWCDDPFLTYDKEGRDKLYEPGTSALRVLRGGFWDSVARVVRAADRRAGEPGLRLADLGFRLARGPRP